MLTPSYSAMIGGLLLWLVWLGISIVAFVHFVRGMRALAEIPRRLERIEAALLTARTGDRDRAS